MHETSFVVIKEQRVEGVWTPIEVHNPVTFEKVREGEFELQIAVMRLRGFVSITTADAFVRGVLAGQESNKTLRARIA